MAEITAALVKELREMTGAGMMDCKKALGEVNGNIDDAVDWLRKKGVASAAKKAGRVASEGLIGVASEGTRAAVVEVNSETDFVARNENFQAFVTTVTQLALTTGGDIEALRNVPYPGAGKTVAEQLTAMIATIGENMQLRRCRMLSADPGVVATYVHNAAAPGLGKIGVLVTLRSSADPAKLLELGRHLAMHVASAAPLFLDTASVDTSAIERERSVLTEQARASGKPEAIIGKMVEGRLRKYYEEVVLLEQIYVIDGESTVAKVVEAAAKQFGAPIVITGFERFKIGEGVAKEEKDFAAEVAATRGL
ncbi:MAG: elongation factor Ts [Alphaproteobacteria bacterium]|nr:elongation factor Ts [Alphaproteobacteria bacterium]